VRVCRHCGKPVTFLGLDKTTKRTKGWAHDEVGDSPWEEPCRINPVTLRNERGTTFAEPSDAHEADAA
jgi:hypothetical protein